MGGAGICRTYRELEEGDWLVEASGLLVDVSDMVID